MKKEVILGVGLFFISLLMINLSYASFSLGDPPEALDKQYAPMDNIEGWINISFDQEPTNSLINGSLGTSMKLIELLESCTSYDYSCNTENCVSDYIAEDKEKTKSFSLSPGESKVIGFKFEEEINEITNASFVLESNVGESCFNQIEIDFLNDNKNDFINPKSTTGDCSILRSYGCFDSSIDSDWFFIEDFPSLYCQRITLPAAPGFKIGADIERGGDTGDIIMALYNSYGESVEEGICTLPADESGEVYCEIDFSVIEKTDYYVCIYAEDGDGDARVEGYPDADGCGFYSGLGDIEEESSSFKIFAERKKSDSIGEINITNRLNEIGSSFSTKITNYIINTYGGLDCSSGCIVPIEIKAKKAQSITLKELDIRYTGGIGSKSNTYFYDLAEEPAEISSDFQKLYLDNGGFSVPLEYGEYIFNLDLNGIVLVSENMSIERVPTITGLSPVETASAVPTTFKVSVSSPYNITEYKWDFGDNETETTETNKVTHVYNSTGSYTLKVEVEDSYGFSAYRLFNITIGLPQSFIEDKIEEYQESLEDINSEVSELAEFYKTSIESRLGLEELEDKLAKIQQEYSGASTESDYNQIVKDLLEMNVPNAISKSEEAKNIPLYPSSEKINLEILQKIAGGDYDASKKSNYVNGILLWNQENLETSFDFSKYSVYYGDYEETALVIFVLEIKKSEGIDSVPYLIIKELENMSFKEDYLQEKESGYFYIDLDRIGEEVAFSTTEDIKFNKIPAFISPEISRLEILEEPVEDEEQGLNWPLFIGIIVLLLIISFIFYIILQEWYKRKYEKYLFKDRNNLYNIISYISNAKKKGLKDSEVISKLKKAGWKKEQIDYAMKKYSGKKTGMLFEVPIKKILSIFKKKRIEKNKPMQKRSFKKYK